MRYPLKSRRFSKESRAMSFVSKWKADRWSLSPTTLTLDTSLPEVWKTKSVTSPHTISRGLSSSSHTKTQRDAVGFFSPSTSYYSTHRGTGILGYPSDYRYNTVATNRHS